jgi:hypothetical protein
MILMVPTNWDDVLIPGIQGLPASVVFYGKLHFDFFGGGRPSIYISPVSRRKARRHISLIHNSGYKFNYLFF